MFYHHSLIIKRNKNVYLKIYIWNNSENVKFVIEICPPIYL